MKQFDVRFNVEFVVVIEADSQREADNIADNEEWQDEILEDTSLWDDVYVNSIEVIEVDEDDSY